MGTLGGTIAGGRRRPLLSRPGKTSAGDAKKAPKPREKKFGESPGPEKMSRDIWKWRSPIWMIIWDSNSCDIKRGTMIALTRCCVDNCEDRTAVELRIGEEFHEFGSIFGLAMISCQRPMLALHPHDRYSPELQTCLVSAGRFRGMWLDRDQCIECECCFRRGSGSIGLRRIARSTRGLNDNHHHKIDRTLFGARSN